VTTAKLMTEVVTAAATQVVAASIPIPVAKPKTLTITAAPAVSTRRRKGVVLVVDYPIVVIDNKPKYKIIKADDTHQFYISFTTLLKNFDREDLETLWRISNVDAASLRLMLFKDAAAIVYAKLELKLFRDAAAAAHMK
nr:hypothetical protein [Tanacetum cinerariifolium]